MTNEWLEFKAYTVDPVFSAENKQSTAFIGRFTVRMIKQNKGFNRIFTVLARGYLFHNADGTLRTDDPYERIEKARKFLCAWCSLPYETVSNKALAFHTSFSELHSEFPNIVYENGAGWYYRYLHSLSDYIKKNKENVIMSKTVKANEKIAEKAVQKLCDHYKLGQPYHGTAADLKEKMAKDEKTDIPVSKLKIAVKCGGGVANACNDIS